MSEPMQLTICQQFDEQESDWWTLRMHVGSQSFLIGPWGGWDTRDEIDDYTEQFRVALTRAGVAGVRVGEVKQPWERLA